MKHVVIGAHLRRDDVEPLADALTAGDIFLSGVAIPDDQPLGDRELLLRVAQIRAALLERATFIAIRYGFSCATAEEAQAKVAAHLARWRELLNAHRDDVEMTLKVAAAAALPRPDRHHFTSGAAYLKALHAHTASADPRFREAVARVLPAARWIPRDNASLECVALVPRARIDDVRAAAESLKRDFPGVPFLLSGPWPLEIFADADRQ